MRNIDTDLLRKNGYPEMADQIEATQPEVDRFMGLVMLFGTEASAEVLGQERFAALMADMTLWQEISEAMYILSQEIRNGQ